MSGPSHLNGKWGGDILGMRVRRTNAKNESLKTLALLIRNGKGQEVKVPLLLKSKGQSPAYHGQGPTMPGQYRAWPLP